MNPLEQRSDAWLRKVYLKILGVFDKYARDGRCAGDMFTGWDWPTMHGIFPTKARLAQRIRQEAKRRNLS